MSQNVFSIINQKGGAGKTTLTLNVACVLGDLHDKKVLMVDVDGQANLTTAMGFDPDSIEFYSGKLITTKKANIKNYIIKTPIKNVDIIPSHQNTFSAEQDLYKMNLREFKLSNVLKSVRDEYDFIFIDTPPNLGLVTLNAIISSSSIIFVYTASNFSLDGISQVLETIEEVQKTEGLNINNTKVVGAICNLFDSRNKIVNKDVEEILNQINDIPKYYQAISRTTEIEKSQFKQKPLHLFYPNHKTTEEFKKFAKELLP